jgi:NAD(P)H-flavin reductase
MVTVPARVQSVERETHDTFTLEVVGEAEPLPRFLPGQFSMLYAFAVGELPISISSDPEEPRRLSYTVRAVGKATEWLVSRERDDSLGVRGPFGAGWPLEKARGRDLLVVAGGIGLAPLRPVIYQVLRHRADFGRLILLYGARSPKDLLFRKQLSRWGRLPGVQVLTTVDYGGLNWKGNVGVVTTLLRRARIEPERTVAMVCGPEIMMRFVATELDGRGVRHEDIYLSMERNMKCGIGHCGHCQYGPVFICKDGPVFPYSWLSEWINRHEI